MSGSIIQSNGMTKRVVQIGRKFRNHRLVVLVHTVVGNGNIQFHARSLAGLAQLRNRRARRRHHVWVCMAVDGGANIVML